ncbi:MAG: CRISPR-associated ring nuclease Csm6 [Roseiarcus sp.]|jgi:CRISPR-associated protein (TIGR02584 family)
MTRRILLATIGATPAVVTETVWALMRERKPAWVPDEIHIVTTAFKLRDVRKALQAPDGPLAGLLGGRPPPCFVHVPRGGGGVDLFAPPRAAEALASVEASSDALADVNSLDDAAAMGDAILRLMGEFTADPSTQVHLSLAGGRKTMSAHALLALTLLGRPSDEASHVLVGPPHLYEDHPEFWHPDQGGLIHAKEDLRKTPRPAPTLDPAGAKITLVPTPAPMLRDAIDERLVASGRLSLRAVVDELNLAARLREQPEIVVDARRNVLLANGVEARLSPKMFAQYRLLAEARSERWPGVAPGVDALAGWLSVPLLCVGATPDGARLDERLLRLLRQAVSAGGGDPDDNPSVRQWESVVIETDPKKKLAFAEAAIESLTRLRDAIDEAFPHAAARILEPGHLAGAEGKRGPDKKFHPDGSIRCEGAGGFGLSLPPESIVIR